MLDRSSPLSVSSRMILEKRLAGIRKVLQETGGIKSAYQPSAIPIGQLREIATRASTLADEITQNENQQRLEGV